MESLQVEGVDHVHVVQVRRGRLVGQVDRVLERQVPHREGLKLGVSGLDPALVLVVELGKAGRQLSRAGARRRDHDQGPRGLDKVVLAVALVGDDQVHVHGIALDGVVQVRALAAHLQHLAERVGRGLALVLRDDHGRHVQAHAAELVHQAQQVHVVGDAQVRAVLAVADVPGVDAEEDLRLVAELLQQADLGVGLKARQHARGVQIVKELAAEFQVELIPKPRDALLDGLGLAPDVQIVVKTDFLHASPPPRRETKTLSNKQGNAASDGAPQSTLFFALTSFPALPRRSGPAPCAGRRPWPPSGSRAQRRPPRPR